MRGAHTDRRGLLRARATLYRACTLYAHYAAITVNRKYSPVMYSEPDSPFPALDVFHQQHSTGGDLHPVLEKGESDSRD